MQFSFFLHKKLLNDSFQVRDCCSRKVFILVTVLLCHILLMTFHSFVYNDAENQNVTLADGGCFLLRFFLIHAVLL